MIALPRHNGAGERDLIRSFTHFKGALRDLPGKQRREPERVRGRVRFVAPVGHRLRCVSG